MAEWTGQPWMDGSVVMTQQEVSSWTTIKFTTTLSGSSREILTHTHSWAHVDSFSNSKWIFNKATSSAKNISEGSSTCLTELNMLNVKRRKGQKGDKGTVILKSRRMTTIVTEFPRMVFDSDDIQGKNLVTSSTFYKCVFYFLAKWRDCLHFDMRSNVLREKLVGGIRVALLQI